jgi:hypothetical protein
MSFQATYSGICEAGDDQIRPGDLIVTDGDGYSHLRCVQITDEPPAAGKPCPRCRLVHAGECF